MLSPARAQVIEATSPPQRAARQPPAIPTLVRRSRQARDSDQSGAFVAGGRHRRAEHPRALPLIAKLTVPGTGVRTSGETIEGGFDSVAGAVSKVPVIGDRISDAFTSAGSGTGGELTSLGQHGIDAVNHLAWSVGLLVAGLPIAVLMLAYLPTYQVRTRAPCRPQAHHQHSP